MSAARVYVIDDSAVMRQTFARLLDGVPDLVLMGSAPNPLVAATDLKRQRPDVLLLDIEMPGMDGLTFLRQVMAGEPIPTVICSTLTAKGSKVAVEALAAGAVAVVGKPTLGLRQFLEDSREEFIQTLRAASHSRPRVRSPMASTVRSERSASGPASAGRSPGAAVAGVHTLAMNKPVVIGCSTGGTQALEEVLLGLPADAPGIAVTQHMPERFTAMYAERLNTLCAMRVREARDGDRLERGLALIAPGGRHMQLRKLAGQYFVKVKDGPPVNRHKPSVDVLFRSAAECAGADAMGVLMTGMGDDGARGMKAMHDRGARCVAQDEASCVVFGMPKEAIALGAVDTVLPLDGIAGAILKFDARA